MSPSQLRKNCRECGRHFSSPGFISKKGYCAACGIARDRAARASMMAKAGPEWERWKASMRRAADA